MKRIGFWLLVGVVLVVVWNTKLGRTVGSYATTFFSKLKDKTKNQVPVDFDLDRVEREIAGLDGDIRKAADPIAEKIAEVKQLRRKIAVTKENLAGQKEAIATM